jgi:hypothetical protein
LDRCDKLLEDLESFKSDPSNQYELAAIEKWMVRELSVKRLKNTGGSAARYEHPFLEDLKGDPTFTIHYKKGGSRREMIFRKNFLNILYPLLRYIIRQMKDRGTCDNQNS